MNSQPKIKVGVLMGGRSPEHEISLISASNVMAAIDKNKYEVIPLGIDKQGHWFYYSQIPLMNVNDAKSVKLPGDGLVVALKVGGGIIDLKSGQEIVSLDVVWPVLHGAFGEDGTMQGFLKIIDLPFVGSSVLGSSVAMDKDVAKRLLTQAGILNARFLTFTKVEKESVDYLKIAKALGRTLFIKPANLGSSVGISKVSDKESFNKAVSLAFGFADKIIIEEFIKGKEIECSVLGNANPRASLPGLVVPRHEFYSYEAKYMDDKGAELEVPANLPDNIIAEIQQLAIKSFKALGCEGMARVDFFLTAKNKLYVNEVNTIPGFTKISMYPKLWEVSGLSQTDLVDELIALGIDRFKREQKLQTSYKE